MDFDTTVKLELYETVVATTRPPSAGELAEKLGAARDEVTAAFERLAEKRLLVLEPAAREKVRMAPPFSGVATPFRVRVGQKTYYANCVWDALGVSAALARDAVVEASDGHTGEPMTLEVRGGTPQKLDCAIHFAVPAARWWDDILHT